MERVYNISNLNENSLFNESNFGYDFLRTLDKEIDIKNAKNEIKKIYIESRKSMTTYVDEELYNPNIIFLSSPMACQLASHILSALLDDESKEKEEKIKNDIRNIVSYKIWNEVLSAVTKAIHNYKKGLDSNNFNHYTIEQAVRNLTNYFSWYLSKPAEYNNELVQYGIFEMILLNSFCIVSELPSKILRNSQNKLHSENSSAVEWRDGFGMYYWNGIRIPKEWILSKECITKSTIDSEVNIERRRCLMEIIGIEKYFELLNITCIDKDIDDCNNPMKLFRTKEKVATINEFLFYLNVIDPSTKREYFIPVPPCYDVHWAKSATFDNKKIQFRQGDVGLLNLEKIFEKPVFET